MKAFKLAVCTAATLMLASPAWAGPHPAYQGVPVDGIATYKRTNKVGQFVFTPEFLEANAKAGANKLATLSFAQGHPPAEWWGRSYYPATLSEVIKSIAYTSRAYRVTTLVYLDGKLVHNSRMDVEKEHYGPTWNTTSFEGADLNGELEGLTPGEHKLVVWRQLDYEVKVMDKATKKVTWEGDRITLAKGNLTIDVTE